MASRAAKWRGKHRDGAWVVLQFDRRNGRWNRIATTAFSVIAKALAARAEKRTGEPVKILPRYGDKAARDLADWLWKQAGSPPIEEI